MRRPLARALALAALFAAVTTHAQTPTGANAFAGRWEITLTRPKTVTDSSSPSEIPFAIVEISVASGVPSAKLINILGMPQTSANPVTATLAGEELSVVLDGGMFKLNVKAKRVGDHLEGTAVPDGQTDVAGMVGRITTKDTLTVIAQPTSPDVQAFGTAMSKSGTARLDALKKFLNDFPTSTLKESASWELALAQPFAADKVAALKRFLEDFPKSGRSENARFELAAAPVAADERRASLKAFVADHPDSRYVEQAEFKITESFPAGPQRDAAMAAFVDSFPKSPYAQPFLMAQFEAELRKTPVDEKTLGAAIDSYLASASGTSLALLKVIALNTVADRLMTSNVALPRAKTLIEDALAVDDKRNADVTTMVTTTHGQVLFKLRDFPAAEAELKHANAIKGGDGELEAHLYLGKLYEALGKNDDALAAYFKAANVAYSGDTKLSLDRLYAKMHGGSTARDAIEAKLDEMERAKPKPFDAGHFTRGAGTAGAGEHVVLAELFTGAECGPCVPADLAFDGIAERYGRDTVAVLIYHLHIPGPDPMTNPDAEARGKYYGVPGTPTVVFDGLAPETMGGIPSMAGARFETYTKRIEARLDAAPRATLSDFTATTSGNTITVMGKAGTAGTGAVHASVHVALVQDLVRYSGSNGVRRHNLVVRKLMGTPAGTPLASPGTVTAIAESIDVSSLGSALDTYLANYEKTGARASSTFKFSDRVDQLDAAHLSVVVFVQDESTKEILQALCVTPVR